MISIPILYENDEILIINKPSGLSVQGGNDVSHSLDKDFSQFLGYKIFLVHRLDKDTSGIMIVAKSSFYANKWTKLIASKKVKREYIAICCGELKNKKGIIQEEIFQHGEKKSAITKYNVEKEWNLSTENLQIPMCLIRLNLETGRMHQIRIHLAKQNCPILGDAQHGNFKINKILKKEFKIKKMMLCSQKIILPIGEKIQTFEIELPQNFVELMQV